MPSIKLGIHDALPIPKHSFLKRIRINARGRKGSYRVIRLRLLRAGTREGR
jgi:hypothetical protein